MAETVKACRVCGSTENKFYRRDSGRLRSECAECVKAKVGKWYRAGGGTLLHAQRTSRLPHVMWSGARVRARRAGLEFTITPGDIRIPERCPILGFVMVRAGGTRCLSPSVDRLDNSRGYVRGNVWVISDRANRLKSDATLSELRLLVSSLERRRFWQRSRDWFGRKP